MEGGTCASMAHSPAYNKCVSGPCEQCRKADARHADAVVSSVIMMSRHTTLSLLDVVVCRIVCQNRKRMVVNFVVPIQKLLQPEGTLASSSLFKLMGPKSASLVLSCCLSAVSTCSFATRLAHVSCENSENMADLVGMPNAMQKAWHISTGMQGSSGLYITNWDAP